MKIIFLIVAILLFVLLCLKSDARFSDFAKLLVGLFLAGILLTFLAGKLSVFTIAAIVIGASAVFLAVLGLLLFLFYKFAIKSGSDERSTKYGWDQSVHNQMKASERLQKYNNGNQASLTSMILPKPLVKRKELIASFSEQYRLNLTSDQVKRIAEASYFSFAWKQEVEAMAGKYDVVYQWFTGNTSFLRVYLYVFPVQDVTSDFTQQRQICIDSLEEVFKYADSLEHLNVDEKIEKINSKFFTNFNDITFMSVYRFLEKEGYAHELDRIELSKKDADIDELLLKYQSKDMQGS